MHRFQITELRSVISKLSSGKACKREDIPIECFKALADSAGPGLHRFLDLLNLCLGSCAVPEDWMQAEVALIFKKGDPALCDNYRPICLLAVVQKIFSALLKKRLLHAGLDARLWKSQFGFRRGRSTEDAIYIARRHIELAHARRSGRLSMMALDWKKAFDSITF